MGKWKYLFWIDLETTGSDEFEDPILEMAWLITERFAPFTILKKNSVIVNPARDEWPMWRTKMVDVVRDMHIENGLLEDIDFGKGISIDDAQTLIIGDLAEVGTKHDFLLSGSGVGHFDRRFLRAQTPHVVKWLQYPQHDVGNLRRALEMLNGGSEFCDQAYGAHIDANEGTKHRALSDILDHHNEWCIYAEFFQWALDTKRTYEFG